MIGSQNCPELMNGQVAFRSRADPRLFQGYLRPIYKNSDMVLEVECGDNKGDLYLSKLCQGSRGPCILFKDTWLTPNEFQYVSGRENAKDWKRSIRHQGKSMKLLLNKGVLSVHPLMCGCEGCKDNTPVNRRRLATKCLVSSPASTDRKRKEDLDEDEDIFIDYNHQDFDFRIGDRSVEVENRSFSEDASASSGSCGNDSVSEVRATSDDCEDRNEPNIWDEDSMDARIRKPYESEISKSPDRELKRESRLTSIIDQLLSTKTKACDKALDGTLEEIENQRSSEESDFEEDDEVDSVLKRLGSIGNRSNTSSPKKPEEDISDSVRSKVGRRLGAKFDTMLTAAHSNLSIKSERLSPDDAQERPDSSPSASPPFNSTPSPRLGIGLGPQSAFDRATVGGMAAGIFPELAGPPTGIPPAGLLNFGTGCTNYSDFIRGLAAKYNNNNNNGGSNNDGLGQNNGFFRGFGNYPTFKTPTPPPISKGFSGIMDFDKRKLEGSVSPGVDLQTSQALLNIVRSASAQSASQLESYLRTNSGLKRPSSGRTESVSPKLPGADPLDLTTATGTGSPVSPLSRKRMRVDTNKDCNELLQQQLKSRSAQNGTDMKPIDWSQILQNRQSSSANDSGSESDRAVSCKSSCTNSSCSDSSQASEVSKWTVDEVCNFVTSVDTCAEYSKVFREQSIDGAVLPLLTEEHLTNNMKMKLGPAIKLRSTLARRIGQCVVCMHCVHCHSSNSGDGNRKKDNP